MFSMLPKIKGQNNLILVSSDQITCFQNDMGFNKNLIEASNLFFLLLLLISGTFLGDLALNPLFVIHLFIVFGCN